jgi:hypothetical protein
MRSRFRGQKLAERAFRSFVVGLVCLSYAAATVGFPIPGQAAKGYSTPFPCQNRRCGCRTADECWRHCCCFTLPERLAWAEANRIEPPAFVRAEVGGGWNLPRRRDANLNGNDQVVCPKEESIGKSRCCRCSSPDAASSPTTSLSKTSPPGSEGKTSFAIGVSARQCQGLASEWISTGVILPLMHPPLWDFDWRLVCWTIPTNEDGPVLPSDPALRPPRLTPQV